MNKSEYEAIVNKLNLWTDAYNKGIPEISDKEWDNYYFEISSYEKEHPKDISSESPTQKVHYTALDKLNKVEHNHLMLSLAKTKNKEDIYNFIGNKEAIIMAKMDGLTCSLTYEKGKLIAAETRGNGKIGEDILHNAYVIPSIPKRILLTNKVVVDGEIICKYDDFEEFSTIYKNPRNFAAGSIRLLDNAECKKRKLTFVAWDFIEGTPAETLHSKLDSLKELGFTVVPYLMFSHSPQGDIFSILTEEIKSLHYPFDGLVIKYDNCDYYNSLGETDHHARGGLAFKFYDEEYPTNLIDIEWSIGRTGILSPIAIFNSVDIDGTSVGRASLHNISVMENLHEFPWKKGMLLTVFKANSIIPQISKVEANKEIENEEKYDIPSICPICKKPTIIKNNMGVKTLWCGNPHCSGKLINQLNYFCSKKGMDIKGLSEATLEKLINWGWVSSIIDIYNLANFKNEWIKKAGFGEKSVTNILQSIEESKNNTLTNFIAALGIPFIGKVAAAQLEEEFKTYSNLKASIEKRYNFSELKNFGSEMNDAIYHFDFSTADKISEFINFKKNLPVEKANILANFNFVITGKLKIFKNREELKNAIEKNGGKVLSSVTSKTSFLINNDESSTSSKNVTAKKLNIPIISEEEFVHMIT